MANRRPAQSLYKGAKWVTVANLSALALSVVLLSLVLIASTKGPHSSVVGSFPGGGDTQAAGRYQALRQEDPRPLQQHQQKQQQAKRGNEEENFHVIFSTDCSAFQDWQSYLVFLSAEAVGHKGPITRIASGCTEEQEALLKGAYAKLSGWEEDGSSDSTTSARKDGEGRQPPQPPPPPQQQQPQFRVHVTPDFSIDEATGKKYVFYNKPGGLQHWLQSEDSPPDGSVIALIDPDFVFMKPLTPKIRSSEAILYSNPVKEEELIEEVREGHPAAQMYGIGDKWIEFNLTYIAGADSPSLGVKSHEAWKHYSIGPPYIVAKADLVKIAQLWHDFVPRVFEGHPHLLAEMYSYSVASAHLNLPHLRLDSYMTSETEAYGEGWPLIDDLPIDAICSKDLSLVTQRLPSFLHYCQHYRVPDSFVFWKRDVPKDIFTSCQSQPIPLPPQEQVNAMLAPLLNTTTTATKTEGGGGIDRKELKKLLDKKYHAFQYCQIAIKVNKALARYKATFC